MNPKTTVPPFFRKKDILILCLILTVTVLLGSFLFFKETGATVVVRINGEWVQSLSLETSGEYIFQNNGHTLTVQVKDGEIGIIHSTCSDKICMKTGFFNTAGATAVCLPAAFSLTVEGTSPVDGITY